MRKWVQTVYYLILLLLLFAAAAGWLRAAKHNCVVHEYNDNKNLLHL